MCPTASLLIFSLHLKLVEAMDLPGLASLPGSSALLLLLPLNLWCWQPLHLWGRRAGAPRCGLWRSWPPIQSHQGRTLGHIISGSEELAV